MNNFGKLFTEDIKSFSLEELRNLLAVHGVIAFKKQNLTDEEYLTLMSAFGTIQNFIEQFVPSKFADKNNGSIILMNNNDFLGNTREYWHIDHTYQGPKFLPVRALYSYGICDRGNTTKFKDLKVLSTLLLKKFPVLIDSNAQYKKLGHKDKLHSVKVCWPGAYFEETIVRYDTRIDSFDCGLSMLELREYAENLIESDQVPEFKLDWEIGDLVIFDNNQALHKRSSLTGQILHKRITTHHWLESQ